MFFSKFPPGQALKSLEESLRVVSDTMHACGYTEKPKSKEQLREMFSWISPLFVARTQVEIVDNVSEVEVVCLPEHRRVRFFSI